MILVYPSLIMASGIIKKVVINEVSKSFKAYFRSLATRISWHRKW